MSNGIIGQAGIATERAHCDMCYRKWLYHQEPRNENYGLFCLTAKPVQCITIETTTICLGCLCEMVEDFAKLTNELAFAYRVGI